VGVHSGPAVGGVVGTHKLRYLVWGKTVVIANKMESTGVPGRVQVSETTIEQIRLRGAAADLEFEPEPRPAVVRRSSYPPPPSTLLGSPSSATPPPPPQIAHARVNGYLVAKRRRRHRHHHRDNHHQDGTAGATGGAHR
jgi:Adenylate cyclase, family 3 (some proteins contain HAMP domain)